MYVSLVPPATFVALVLLSWGRGRSARDAIAIGATLICSWIVLVTEIASSLHELTRQVLIAAWAVGASSAIAASIAALRGDAWRVRTAATLARWRAMPRDERAMILMPLVSVGVLVVIGSLAPPNTYDSMTYHMSRVAHWIQNESVAFYPTSIERQNEPPPFAEFVILHLQLLSESDRWANSVQTFGVGLTAALASTVAAEFGARAPVQWLAAVVATTAPMVMLQGASTQNDVVVSALCLAFALFTLRAFRRLRWSDVILAGLALGLALLAKGTAYILCAALGPCLLAAAMSSRPRPSFVAAAVRANVIVLVAIVVNAGFFARTYEAHGRPLPQHPAGQIQEVTIEGTLANVVRNYVMHFGLPGQAARDATAHVVEAMLGDASRDPRTTVGLSRFAVYFSSHEDATGSPMHLLLVSIATAMVAASRRHATELRLYAVALGLAALLYCALVRWQPWAVRLHTPFLVMGAPLVACWIGTATQTGRRNVFPIALVLFLGALPYLIAGKPRSIVPREGRSVITTPRLDQYFNNHPELKAPYVSAMVAALASNPDEVGLVFGVDDWEYPLWVLAGNAAVRRPPRFRHLADEAGSLRGHPASWPAVIVSSTNVPALEASHALVFASAPIRVYQRRL